MKFFTTLLFTCLILSILQAQESDINLHFLDINKDKPGAEYKFTFVHLTDVHIGEGDEDGDYGTEGYVDLPPDGDIGYPAERLRKTVNWLNQNHTAYGIDFIVVSGDLTDSGEESEFYKFKEIMSSLEIPYVPLIGNHDVWPYTKDTVAPLPTGDSLINTIFEDVYEANKLFFDAWDDGTRLTKVYNPQSNNYNYLQNFSFVYQGFEFLMLDFDTRHPARNNEPGIGPEAEIMDFEGGSWDWTKNKIENSPYLGDQNLFIVSHHPPVKELWGILYAFDIEETRSIMDFLFQYKNHIAVWLAGHIHRSLVYNVGTVGLQPYQVLRCAETAANKEYDKGLVRLVDVYESSISTFVDDQMLMNNIDIYPNPSSQLFNLFIKDNDNKYVEADVFNNTGQLVWSSTLTLDHNTRLFSIDLANQAKGIYHLRLKNGDDMISHNLILQ
ncbi:MAG: metallophosphoesterase [Chitinophagales bacterium]